MQFIIPGKRAQDHLLVDGVMSSCHNLDETLTFFDIRNWNFDERETSPRLVLDGFHGSHIDVFSSDLGLSDRVGWELEAD